MTEPSPDIAISRRFTRLYMLALTAVAFLSVLGQVLIQWTLNSQLNDSWIVNYAGRQRFQSQQMVKDVLLLTDRAEKVDTGLYLADIKQTLVSWEKYHKELKNGDLVELGVSVTNSDTVQRMFAELEPHFQAIRTQLHRVIALLEAPGSSDTTAVRQSVESILAHERTFLQQMDQIVFQYDYEAKAKVKYLRKVELLLLAVTICVLMVEGLLIFRPAVKKLRQTILQLLAAQNQARQMNKELVSLNQSLKEAKRELLEAAHQKHQQQMSEQKLRAAYLIEGQEEERKRLARELHDGLGQMLTALKLGIENVRTHATFTEKGFKAMTDLKSLIGQTIQETRTISFNLMPAVLGDFGIASALKLLTAQTANSTGANITFTSNFNGERLPKNVEVGMYRIAQEGIHNAVKYAQARRITVELVTRIKYVHLVISDDGKGFTFEDVHADTEQNGIANGIYNMQERAQMISGLMKIDSRPGKGTKIHFKLPMIYLEDEQNHRVISR